MRSESLALFPANSPRTRRSRAAWEISQGKTQNLVARRRRIYKAHRGRRWRTSWSRSHWSRVYHTSYPVPVRRPALLDWGGTLPLVALACGEPYASLRLQTQPRDCAIALLLAFGSTNTWRGDLHPTISVPCLEHMCSSADAWSLRSVESGGSVAVPSHRLCGSTQIKRSRYSISGLSESISIISSDIPFSLSEIPITKSCLNSFLIVERKEATNFTSLNQPKSS
jgi:hypothetical protein